MMEYTTASTLVEYDDPFTKMVIPLKQAQSTSITSVSTTNEEPKGTDVSEEHNQGMTSMYVNILSLIHI